MLVREISLSLPEDILRLDLIVGTRTCVPGYTVTSTPLIFLLYGDKSPVKAYRTHTTLTYKRNGLSAQICNSNAC